MCSPYEWTDLEDEIEFLPQSLLVPTAPEHDVHAQRRLTAFLAEFDLQPTAEELSDPHMEAVSIEVEYIPHKDRVPVLA